MPYRPEHRAQIRTRIVRSARTLFNRHGFNGVSIDDLMAHAGLTRGAFYNYFHTKSDLYAEAVALALAEPPSERWAGLRVDFNAIDAARQIIRGYLSRQHFEDVDGSCPMVAVPSDVSRSDPVVKRAFEQVFKAMVALFEEGLRREGTGDRKRALAIAGICVGGMVVARSIESIELGDALRDAAMSTALQLGGWSETRPRRSARGAAFKMKASDSARRS
jgi:AcrR family transcriptional regulator